MTARKSHTWTPNNAAAGKPMRGTGALEQLCVNRHARDVRDAVRLLRMLDLVGAR
jgi:hypothetical protein